ncbi:MAG: MurR/RpiR family transcriptional regulator [Actinomycetota bacterium]
MTTSGILVRIRESVPELTGAERRVADYVAAEPDETISLSITDLAQRSSASEATVVRLCKKLQLRGYQDLRIALAQDVGDDRIREIHEDVELDDDAGTVMSKVFAGAKRALDDTLAIANAEEMQKALDALSEVESLSFFGIGASGAVARDAYYRFMKLGYHCYALTDSSSQMTRVATMGPHDGVVAISHSGRSRDLVAAVEAASERGAVTIGITQFGRQPLVSVCDVTLFTSSGETAFRSEAMASRIAEHALLDSLLVGLSLTRYEQTVSNLESVRTLTQPMRLERSNRREAQHGNARQTEDG